MPKIHQHQEGNIHVPHWGWDGLVHHLHLLVDGLNPQLRLGEMTVLLEKLTLFPNRFPLNLPCFPFNLCTNPLMYFLLGGVNVESTLQEVPGGMADQHQ